MLNLYIKCFFNPFIGIGYYFSDSSFNSFAISTCFVLFGATFVLNFFQLIIKICLFYKIININFLAQSARANLAEKFSNINLLNSGAVIYLS